MPNKGTEKPHALCSSSECEVYGLLEEGDKDGHKQVHRNDRYIVVDMHAATSMTLIIPSATHNKGYMFCPICPSVCL